MAEIIEQNPGSSEIQSPLIAGLTSGLNVLSKVLNLETAKAVNQSLTAVPIDSENKNRIYEAPFGFRLWLNDPAVVVKKNGEVVTQRQVPYTIDHVGGSITFQTPLLDQDKVSVDVTYIKPVSTRLTGIEQREVALEKATGKYKGFFSDEKTLSSSIPKGTDGDFAIVGTPAFSVYTWDGTHGKWANTQTVVDLSNFYTKEDIDRSLAQKEPLISTGTAKEYFSGEKKWKDIDAAVRGAALTGFKASSGSVGASDTVLTALQKLQGQATEKKSYLSGSGAPATSLAADIGQRYVNTANGDWYTCTARSGNSYTWEKGLNEQPGMGLYPTGKAVTDNNFTTQEKEKLARLENYNDSAVRELIASKVEKQPGKGLSTNDFTTSEKQALAKKVVTVNGKGIDGYGNVQLTAEDVGAMSPGGKVGSASNADKLGGNYPSYFATASSVQVFKCTFPLNWVEDYWTESWTQTVNCTGMNSSYYVSAPEFVPTTYQSTNEKMAETLNILNAGHIETMNGQVRATVYEKPTSEITVYFRRVVMP